MKIRWPQNWTRRKRIVVIIITVLVVLPVLYYSLTEIQIRRSVHYFTQPHGCVELQLLPDWAGGGEPTSFLILMGKRSIPAIRKVLSNPDLGPNERIHIAWILSSVGEFSHFGDMVEALKDQRTQSIAAWRMCDFPSQCFLYRDRILEIGTQFDMGSRYFILLLYMGKDRLSPDVLEKLQNLADGVNPKKKRLSENEVAMIKKEIESCFPL